MEFRERYPRGGKGLLLCVSVIQLEHVLTLQSGAKYTEAARGILLTSL